MNHINVFFLIALFGFPEWANAVCPEKPVPICERVRESQVVVRAKVVSTQRLVDEDDPEGIAGWVFHLDVVKDYRNGKSRRLAVMSENTTQGSAWRPVVNTLFSHPGTAKGSLRPATTVIRIRQKDLTRGRNKKSWPVCTAKKTAIRTEEYNCFRDKVVRSAALNASLYMDSKCVRYQTGFKNP